MQEKRCGFHKDKYSKLSKILVQKKLKRTREIAMKDALTSTDAAEVNWKTAKQEAS